VSRPSAMDGHVRLSAHQNQGVTWLPHNPSALLFHASPLSSPERVSERGGRHADWPEERRHHASARRRATVVEQSCCDALSWEPEPINPRVCGDERRCSGSPSWTPTGSDPATAGLGKPRCATSFARVWDRGFFSFSYSIQFCSTLIRTISYFLLR
jgi:hypothetical protein